MNLPVFSSFNTKHTLKKAASIAFLLVVTGLSLSAQKPRTSNLPNYDRERLHFGFTLGVNSANFRIQLVKDFSKFDSLKTVLSTPSTGFNLGIVSELSIHELLKLRFVPDLSFAQRNIEYYFDGKVDLTRTRTIESTFIEFPLDLKLKSRRVYNFAGAVIVGVKYVIDLASQKDTKNTSPSTATVKLKKDDIAYEAGAGIDFYLPYFKFGIDVKLSLGMKNLLVDDNTIFSDPIQKLNSKVILLSFTFEG